MAALSFLAAPTAGVQPEGLLNQWNVMCARARSVKIRMKNRHCSSPFFNAFVVPEATKSAGSEESILLSNQFRAVFYRPRKDSETKFVLTALTCNYAITGANLRIYIGSLTVLA